MVAAKMWGVGVDRVGLIGWVGGAWTCVLNALKCQTLGVWGMIGTDFSDFLTFPEPLISPHGFPYAHMHVMK